MQQILTNNCFDLFAGLDSRVYLWKWLLYIMICNGVNLELKNDNIEDPLDVDIFPGS